MSKILAINGGPSVVAEEFPSWPIWDQTDVRQVQEAVESGVWGIAGPKIEQFAKAFAEFQHVKYAWPVANGSLAIELALRALRVGAGDEVIVPDYTFMATAAAVIYAGAKPVFVDVDSGTFCIDVNLLEDAITDKTWAVIPVHFGGHPCDMHSVMDIAARHNLFVIEDCAHAPGAMIDDGYVGAFGEVGTFSLQSSKTLSAGEGGIVVTGSERLLRVLKSLHNTGRADMGAGYRHYLCGTNYRISELQAALLLGQIARLEEQCERRDRNGAVLNELLEHIDGVRPQQRAPFLRRHGYYLYTFVLEAGIPRDAFRAALAAEGVPVQLEYPAVHGIEFIRKMGLGGGDFPVSQELAERSIWLCHNALLGERRHIEMIAEAVRKVAANREELEHIPK